MQNVTEETTRSNTEIAIYHGQSVDVEVAVRFQNEEAWTTQAQMVALFGRDRSVIGKHIANVYEEGELSKEAVCAFFALTADDGKNYEVAHFALDMVIAVGFRVKSKEGTAFRKWAIKKLKTQPDQRFARLEAQVRTLECLVRQAGAGAAARQLPPHDDWMPRLAAYLADVPPAFQPTVGGILYDLGIQHVTRADQMRVARSLQSLGYARFLASGPKRCWKYRRAS